MSGTYTYDSDKKFSHASRAPARANTEATYQGKTIVVIDGQATVGTDGQPHFDAAAILTDALRAKGATVTTVHSNEDLEHLGSLKNTNLIIADKPFSDEQTKLLNDLGIPVIYHTGDPNRRYAPLTLLKSHDVLPLIDRVLNQAVSTADLGFIDKRIIMVGDPSKNESAIKLLQSNGINVTILRDNEELISMEKEGNLKSINLIIADKKLDIIHATRLREAGIPIIYYTDDVLRHRHADTVMNDTYPGGELLALVAEKLNPGPIIPSYFLK